MNSKISKYLLSIFLSSLFLINSSTAQNRYNFDQFFDDSKELIKQPANWDSKDFLKLGAIAGSAFLIMNVDEDVRGLALSERKYFYSFPVEFGRIWGEPYTTGLITGGLVIHSLISGVKKNRETAFEVAESFIYTGTITAALKLSFGRARPFTGKNSFTFRPFQQIDNEFRSFPSGHTSTAFSLSTVLAARAKHDWQKVLYFVPAVMTALSRVYQNHHWLSDVFVGGGLGYFIGKFVTDLHDKNAELELLEPTEQIHLSFYF